jgi:exopolysaccharide biosynthesis polyprenyl glycosylphosphotransferase
MIGGARVTGASATETVAEGPGAIAVDVERVGNLQERPGSPERLVPSSESFISAGRRGYILRRLLAVSDLLALLTSWAAILGLSTLIGRHSTMLSELGLFVLIMPSWLLVASSFSLYHLSDRRLDHTIADEIGPIVLAITVWSWAFLLLRAAALRGPVELLPSIGLWAVAIIAIPALRTATRAFVRRARWYRQRAVIVGTSADVRRVSRRVNRHPELGLELISTLTLDDAENSAPKRNGRGARVRREALVATIGDEIEATSASRVILASAPGDLQHRSELLRALSDQRVHVDLISADADVMATRSVIHHIEGLPVLTVPAVRSTKAAHVMKRGMDASVAGISLLALSPFLAYCAIRIKLDSRGPVFFRQERIGRRLEPFTVVKFRTMVRDAEERKADVERLNVHRDTETPGMFKIHGDPRVTRFGAWLRRWSLDEIPQLWNVLKGDMSLVGPRPLIPTEASLVGGPYEARFDMAPGITGRWQTLGRSDIGFEDMIKLDYTYVAGWSFAEDIRLLMRTAAVVGNRRGAY